MKPFRWLRHALAELGDALRGPCPNCEELRGAARRVLAEADATTSIDQDELTAEWREALAELRMAVARLEAGGRS